MVRGLSAAESPRPRRPAVARVGFLTPNLQLGGAERWIVSLLKYLDRAHVEPSGIAILGSDAPHAETCLEAARYAPLYGGPLANGNGAPLPVQRSPTQWMPWRDWPRIPTC
jgi:hypothetical protein